MSFIGSGPEEYPLSEFLAATVAFPTVVFTTLLGILTVYWSLVIFGALKVEMGGDADVDLSKDFDMGGKGALGGDVDGHADFDMGGKGALGGDHGGDVHFDGDGHLHLDGKAGGLDIDGDADADLDKDGKAASGGFLDAVGLSGVPITVAFSFLFLYAWTVSMLTNGYVAKLVGGGLIGFLGGVGVGLVALGVALPGAALSIKPLKKLFRVQPALSHHGIVGRVCRISTQRVTAEFGQAEVAGDDLLIPVRCAKANTLTRGDEAVIYDYDAEKALFHVIPRSDVVGGQVDV